MSCSVNTNLSLSSGFNGLIPISNSSFPLPFFICSLSSCTMVSTSTLPSLSIRFNIIAPGAIFSIHFSGLAIAAPMIMPYAIPFISGSACLTCVS